MSFFFSLLAKLGVTSHFGTMLFKYFISGPQFHCRHWLTSYSDLTNHRSKSLGFWLLRLIRGPPWKNQSGNILLDLKELGCICQATAFPLVLHWHTCSCCFVQACQWVSFGGVFNALISITSVIGLLICLFDGRGYARKTIVSQL